MSRWGTFQSGSYQFDENYQMHANERGLQGSGYKLRSAIGQDLNVNSQSKGEDEKEVRNENAGRVLRKEVTTSTRLNEILKSKKR